MAEASQLKAATHDHGHDAAVPGNGISVEEKRRQLERVIHSQTLSTSPQLRRFLEYVANATIEGRQDDLKEYALGIKVFGRTSDFDPRLDTLVRSQASRLRLKLEAFYKTEGTADEILLELPRGHYVPRFERRQPPAEVVEDRAGAKQVEAPPPGRAGLVSRTDYLIDWHFRLPRRAAITAAGLILLLAVGLGIVSLRAHAKLQSNAAAAPPLASEFWSAFVDGKMPPVVSYSNHVYLMNESSDLLRYYGDATFPKGTLMTQSNLPVRDQRMLKYMGPVFFNDGFTGAGEVYAVASLTRVFAQLGTPLTVTRSQLLSSADLNQRNLIVIGHPGVNGVLKRLQLGPEFAFDWSHGDGPWGGRLLNRHPQAGESSIYAVERDPVTKALRADYALATFMPGIALGRKLAVLAGVTTEGTRGVAEFLASDDGIAQIASHCGIPGKYGHPIPPPFFQAVLRIEIAKGDIFRIQYVTGRILHP
ncbi:MAG TPA: hypothetical protein VGH38_10025 [Bryobacteraceae bacterium]|jgi:hypothetical protein